jgi:hypothetical protein
MTQGKRVAAQRTELWSRWKAGQSLHVRHDPRAISSGRRRRLWSFARLFCALHQNWTLSQPVQDALDEINRIQTRQRLNTVVSTGVPGFIPQTR